MTAGRRARPDDKHRKASGVRAAPVRQRAPGGKNCLLLLACLTGCDTLNRVTEIGRAPPMTAPSDPTADARYRPVSMPMPHPTPSPVQAGSLWRGGSRAFFKDQRAAQVGDIVTVLVNTTDTADVENASTETRQGSETMGVPNFFGLEAQLPRILSKAVNASSLVSASSAGSAGGTGVIKRNETVTLRLAGVITQVLPNGNLVVAARQEKRRHPPAGHRQRQHGAA
jgi:flagellar L-ring protein precursor FlgH